MAKRLDEKSGALGPGVFTAPWTGPRGETILVAVAFPAVRLCERMLGPEDSRDDVIEELWWLLQRHKAGMRVI